MIRLTISNYYREYTVDAATNEEAYLVVFSAFGWKNVFVTINIDKQAPKVVYTLNEAMEVLKPDMQKVKDLWLIKNYY